MNKKFGAIAVFMVIAVLLSVFTVSVYATDTAASSSAEVPSSSIATPDSSATPDSGTDTATTPDTTTTTAGTTSGTSAATTGAAGTSGQGIRLHLIVSIIVFAAVIAAIAVVAFGLPKNREKTLKLFRSVKSESKKVSWYSWSATKKATIVVLSTVVAITLVIWALDFLFGKVFYGLIPQIFAAF